MQGVWADLCKNYPIKSIEDPLDEDDWAGFSALTGKVGESVQIVGDDLYVTNPSRLARGIEEAAGNAILINQIGTLTETMQAITMAQKLALALLFNTALVRQKIASCRFGCGNQCRSNQTGALLPDIRKIQPTLAY